MMIRRLLILGLSVHVFACASNQNEDILDLHRQYLEATASFDLVKVAALTADDFEWDLGTTPVDKEGSLRIIKKDAADSTEFSWENVVARGDTVECDLIVSNELLRRVGTKQIRLFPRFIFGDGLLRRLEYWQPSSDARESERRITAFRQWTMRERPDQVSRLVDADGNRILSQEASTLMLELADEWTAAGRPGLE